MQYGKGGQKTLRGKRVGNAKKTVFKGDGKHRKKEGLGPSKGWTTKTRAEKPLLQKRILVRKLQDKLGHRQAEKKRE